MNGNFKIMALKDYEDYFIEGDIIEFKNGHTRWRDGSDSYIYKDYAEFISRNITRIGYFELIEDVENKMEDLRELIVVGRVVKFDDGKISRVEINNLEELCFSGEHWFPVARLNSNLKYSDMKIVEIYGRCGSNADAWKLSTDHRNLIWKRTEKSPTQFKLEELEKKQREIADEMEKLRKEM